MTKRWLTKPTQSLILSTGILCRMRTLPSPRRLARYCTDEARIYITKRKGSGFNRSPFSYHHQSSISNENNYSTSHTLGRTILSSKIFQPLRLRTSRTTSLLGRSPRLMARHTISRFRSRILSSLSTILISVTSL